MKLRSWLLLPLFLTLLLAPATASHAQPGSVTDEKLERFDREMRREMYLRWHHDLVDRFNSLLNQIAFIHQIGKQTKTVKVSEAVLEHMKVARGILASSMNIGRVNAANQPQESLDTIDKEFVAADAKLNLAERVWAKTHPTESIRTFQTNVCLTRGKGAEPLSEEDIDNKITPVMKCLSEQKISFGDRMVLTYNGLVPMDEKKPLPLVAKLKPTPPTPPPAKPRPDLADQAIDQAIDEKLKDEKLTDQQKSTINKLSKDEKRKTKLKKLLAKSTSTGAKDAAQAMREQAKKDIDAALASADGKKSKDTKKTALAKDAKDAKSEEKVESENSVEVQTAVDPQPSLAPAKVQVAEPTDQNRSDKSIASQVELFNTEPAEPKSGEKAERKEIKADRLKALNKLFQKKVAAQATQLRGRGKLVDSWKSLLADKEAKGKLSENLTDADLLIMRDQLELESYDLSEVMPDPYFKDGLNAWAQSLRQLKSKLDQKSSWAEKLLALTEEVNQGYFRDPVAAPDARFMDLLKAPEGTKQGDPSQKNKLYLSLLQESKLSLPPNLIPLLQKNTSGKLSVVFYDTRADTVFDPDTGKSMAHWDEPLISTSKLLYFDVAKVDPNQKLPPEAAFIRIKAKPAPVIIAKAAPVVASTPTPEAKKIAQATQEAAKATAAPKKKGIGVKQFFKNIGGGIGVGLGVAGIGVKFGAKVLYKSPKVVWEFFKHLDDIDLSDVDLSGIDWSKVDVSDVDWSKIDVSKIDWSVMKDLKVDWKKVDFSKVDLSKLDWSQVDAIAANWSKIDPTKVNWSKVDLSRVDFTKIDVDKIDPKKIDTTELLSKVESEKRRRSLSKVRDPSQFREDLRLRGRSVAVETTQSSPIEIGRDVLDSKNRDRGCNEVDKKCEKTIKFTVNSQKLADQLIRSRSLEEDISIIKKAFQDEIAKDIEKVADAWLPRLRSPSTPPQKGSSFDRDLTYLESTVISRKREVLSQVYQIASHLGLDSQDGTETEVFHRRKKKNLSFFGWGEDRRYRKSFKDDDQVLATINQHYRKQELASEKTDELLKSPKIKELIAAAKSYESLPIKDPMLFATIYESMSLEDRTAMLNFLEQVVQVNHMTRAGNPQLVQTIKRANLAHRYPYAGSHLSKDRIIDEKLTKQGLDEKSFKSLDGYLNVFALDSEPRVPEFEFRAKFAPFLAGVIKGYRPVQAIEPQVGQEEQKERKAIKAVKPVHIDGVAGVAGEELKKPDPHQNNDEGNFQAKRVARVEAVHVDEVKGRTGHKSVLERKEVKERAGEEYGYEPEQVDTFSGLEWEADLLADSYLKIGASQIIRDLVTDKFKHTPFKSPEEIKKVFKAFLPEVSGYFLKKLNEGGLTENDKAMLRDLLLTFYPWITSPELTPEQRSLPGVAQGSEIREDIAELLSALIKGPGIKLPDRGYVHLPTTQVRPEVLPVSTQRIRNWMLETDKLLAPQAP